MNNAVGSSTAASASSTFPPSALEPPKEKSSGELFKSKSLFIPAEKVNQLVQELGLNNPKQLLPQLVELAKTYSRPPISNYRVGEAGRGMSGNVYFGINVEFWGCPLSYAIHGEQFLIASARIQRERKVETIALPAEPCGHCRQFMNEIGDENDIELLIPGSPPINLSALLPKPFGPKNLGIEGGLLTRAPEFRSSHGEPLVAKAIEAAYDSYAPHTKSPSGVALQTKDGKIYQGCYLENAAFNPSLPPLQYALVALLVDRGQYEDIEQVVLVEHADRKTSQKTITQDLLSNIAPNAKLNTIIVDSFQ